MASERKAYLQRKDSAYKKVDFIRDFKQKAEILNKITLWDQSDQSDYSKVNFEEMDNQIHKNFKEYLVNFWKDPAKADGPRLLDYFNWMHVRVLWLVRKKKVQDLVIVWLEGLGIIAKLKSVEGKPTSFLELKHRNLFAPLLHEIIDQETSMANISALLDLLQFLVRERSMLKTWMNCDENTVRKHIHREHINLVNNYGQYYSKFTLNYEQAIEAIHYELHLIVKYDLLDHFYMQFILRALDAATVYVNNFQRDEENSGHPFVHTCYLIHMAETVSKMYANRADRQQDPRIFSKDDLRDMRGIVHIYYAHHMLYLLNVSIKYPGKEPDLKKLFKIKEIAVKYNPRRATLCPTIPEKQDCYKYAHYQLKEALKLLTKKDETVDAIKNYFNELQNNYDYLQVLNLSLDTQEGAQIS